MPTYKFMVSGVVEVDAPNVAQAWRFIRQKNGHHEVARISAGSGTHCRVSHGRNVDLSQYRLSARSVKGTKKIVLLKTPAKKVDCSPQAEQPALSHAYVTVVVSGPGGVISWPARVITNALTVEGFNVNVETNYPRPYVAPWPRGGEDATVRLVEQHQPWGG